MATQLCRIARQAGFCLAAVLLASTTSRAHVTLDSPNGGETLDVGSLFSIEWHPTVQHDPANWDLWYSTTSSNGPWEVISENLPVGDPSVGSQHLYDWLVPDLGNTDAWVRVRQDNSGQDYFDVSDASFSIVAPFLAGDFNEDGKVGSGDLTNWDSGYGTPAGASHAQGDADDDGDVDGRDLLVWQQQAEGGSPLAAVQSVPEPAGLILLTLGCCSLGRWSCR